MKRPRLLITHREKSREKNYAFGLPETARKAQSPLGGEFRGRVGGGEKSVFTLDQKE